MLTSCLRLAAPAHHEWLYIDDQPVASVWVADGFWSRLRGVHGIRDWRGASALYLVPCNRIHGMGMRMPLDVGFVDKEGRLLRLDRLYLGRVLAERTAHAVYELIDGEVQRLGLKTGQVLASGNER